MELFIPLMDDLRNRFHRGLISLDFGVGTATFGAGGVAAFAVGSVHCIERLAIGFVAGVAAKAVFQRLVGLRP